jgi:hypothetical protein
MEALIETLNTMLRERKPETVTRVRQCCAKLSHWPNQDALDLMRSRAREHEVLDILDQPAPRFTFVDHSAQAESIPAVRLERRLGMLPGTTMAEIRRAMAFAVDLG